MELAETEVQQPTCIQPTTLLSNMVASRRQDVRGWTENKGREWCREEKSCDVAMNASLNSSVRPRNL